jgi:hypothetical protein
LANSPPLPLVVYWGNPGTFDTDKSIDNAILALGHRDRVRRMTLYTSESSLPNVFSSMDGLFPILETLQLGCSSDKDLRKAETVSKFEAPNLRYLQISDLKLLPPSLLHDAATRPSIVTLSIGEITTNLDTLMASLALMPHLKVLKIGVSFSIPSDQTERKERELSTGKKPDSAPLALTDLEEFEYQGISDYLEAFAARISAPFLKKLSITVSNEVDEDENLDATTFKYLSRLISGAANLAFQFARVRFKDGFSIVMDHDELWTGRGAFELKFNHRRYYFEATIGLVTKVCHVLAPTPSIVQSLLLEDAHRNSWDRQRGPDREEWRELLRVFDNVKTLRLAGRFVKEVDKALDPKPNDQGSTLLPRLQEIVRYGADKIEKQERSRQYVKEVADEKKFVAFVEARQVAGSPVRVVDGPQNRLTLY